MLAQRDRFPHISMRRLDGTTFVYADVWQRRHLLLLNLAAEGVEREDEETRYVADLAVHAPDLQRYDAAVVVTRDVIPGLQAPSVLIVDRWGEIVAVESAPDMASLTRVDELLEWLRMIAHACSW